MTKRKIVMSFSCPEEIADKIDDINNRSAFIVEAIRTYQEDLLNDKELAYKIKKDIDNIDKEIEKKKKKIKIKKEKFQSRVGIKLEDFLADNKFESKKIDRINKFLDMIDAEERWDGNEIDLEREATKIWDLKLRENFGLSGRKAINFVKDCYKYYEEMKE